jgi:hypothetical protein
VLQGARQPREVRKLRGWLCSGAWLTVAMIAVGCSPTGEQPMTALGRPAQANRRFAVLACGLAGWGLLTACGTASNQAPALTGTAKPSAAQSPSVGAGPLLQPESCQRVTTGADGNVGPVLCPNGHPNA